MIASYGVESCLSDDSVGSFVTALTVGESVGRCVCSGVGFRVGSSVGAGVIGVGSGVGTAEGSGEGRCVGVYEEGMWCMSVAGSW